MSIVKTEVIYDKEQEQTIFPDPVFEEDLMYRLEAFLEEQFPEEGEIQIKWIPEKVMNYYELTIKGFDEKSVREKIDEFLQDN